MDLHTLPSIVKTKMKRLGQGHGSGRVKTSGRGTKGQNARSDRPIYFEGGALPLIKRLPFIRGKDKNNPFHTNPVVINLSDLAKLPVKAVVDLETLLAYKIVSKDAKTKGVKLLAKGDVDKAYTLKIPASFSAVEKIKKAGGIVE